MSTNEVIRVIKDYPQHQVSGWNHGKFEYYAYQRLSNFEAETMIFP